MKGSSANLYERLSRISPIRILLAYLSIIPVFACVFCFLPGQSFYAPYARLEPSVKDDTKAVENNIRAAMAESYRTHGIAFDGWQVAVYDLSVGNLGLDADSGLTFTVYYFATQHVADRITGSTGGPQFTADLSPLKMTTLARPGNVVCHFVSIAHGLSADKRQILDYRSLFAPPLTVGIVGDVVCWGDKEELAMQSLVAGWSGDPRGLSGFWARMAYFSATTMTTVGFGDIVPLTGWARILTASEAIIGWVLAGLFLNSIASRIGRSLG